MNLFSRMRFSRSTNPAVAASPLSNQAELLKPLLMSWILGSEANQRWLVNHFPLLESDVEYQRVLTFENVVAIVDKYQAQRSSRSLSQRVLSWVSRSTARFEQLHAVIRLHRELCSAFPTPSTLNPSIAPMPAINVEIHGDGHSGISRSLKDRLREAMSALSWRSGLYKSIKIFQFGVKHISPEQDAHVTQTASQVVSAVPSGSPNSQTSYFLPNGVQPNNNQSLYQATSRVLEHGLQALNIYGAYKQSGQDLRESERLVAYTHGRDINVLWRKLIISRYLPSSEQLLKPVPWFGYSDGTIELHNPQGPRLLLHMGRLQTALQTLHSRLNAQPVSEAETSRAANTLALILWEGIFLSPHIISRLWDVHHKLVKDLQQLIQQYPNWGPLEELHKTLRTLTTDVIVNKSSQGIWPASIQVYQIFVNSSSDDWRILHNKLMYQLQQQYIGLINAYRPTLGIYGRDVSRREALKSLNQYARYVIETMMLAETKEEAESSRQAFEAVNTQLATWAASLHTPSPGEERYTLLDSSTPAGKLMQSLRKTHPRLFAGMDCQGRVSAEDFQQIRNAFTKRYHPDRPPTSKLSTQAYAEGVKTAIIFFKETKAQIELRARDRALNLARQSLQDMQEERLTVYQESVQAINEVGMVEIQIWRAVCEVGPTIDKAARLHEEVSCARQKAVEACGTTPVLECVEQVCLEVQRICEEVKARREMVTQQVKDIKIRLEAIQARDNEVSIKAANAMLLCIGVDNQTPEGVHLYQDAVKLELECIEVGRQQLQFIYEQARVSREEAQAYRNEALTSEHAIRLYQQVMAVCQMVQHGQTDVQQTDVQQMKAQLRQMREETLKFRSQINESFAVVTTEIPSLSDVPTTLFAASPPDLSETASPSSSMYNLD